ncbi:T6SS effector BTH_I2691 family protein [Cobetia sp. 5-11-6-3]|uniref:T6SS effector BTH_I2691 family protein n=1 Tax=Cobetia sp. 5-11-6-3 TaxID=2737458 RepID=UPI0015968FB2|nr:T6SS effector BTH_I2691 family protein [Cobetia sp. 5-11-6-3]
MSADDTTSIANCSFCRGEGLPILPVRYAIARTDSKIPAPRAPVVNGPFGEGVTDVATLPDGQDYTLRLMRAGFLYVYNEAAGTWSGYVVTEKGYLYAYVKEIEHSLLVAMDPENPTQGVSNKLKSPSNEVEFSCATDNSAHQYPGRCITIPDAANADNIYLAFSDTAWTNRVWHEHATNAEIEGTSTHRRDQMRQLSLSEWRGGQASHASSISTVSQYVAEASIEELTNKQVKDSIDETGLEFSLDPVNGIAGDVDNLVSWADSKSVDDVPAVMIALDDPVGITSDVAMLMNKLLDEFNEQPDIKWPLSTSIQIDSIERAVKGAARSAYLDSTVEAAVTSVKKTRAIEYIGEQYSESNVDIGFDEYLEQRVIDTYLGDSAEYNSDSVWKSYSDRMADDKDGNTKKEVWERDILSRKTKELESKLIQPLSMVHLAWINSRSLLLCIDSNHDNKDIYSGISFGLIILRCVSDTQKYSNISQQYVDWLQSEKISHSNLLLRSLVLDQSELKDIIQSGIEKTTISGEDAVNLPWAGVLDGTSAILDKITDAREVSSKLIGIISSSCVHSLSEKNINKFKRPIFLLLGAISKKAIVNVKVSASNKRELYKVLRRSMISANPDIEKIPAKQFYREMDLLTRREGRGAKHVGNGRWDYHITYEHYALVNMDIHSGSSLKSISQNMIDSNGVDYMASERKNGAFSDYIKSHDVGLSAVSLIIGSLSLGTQLRALSETQPGEKKILLYTKLAAIGFGIIGAMADVVKAVFTKRSISLNKFSTFKETRLYRYSEMLGRALGIISGVLFAALDFKSAYKAYTKDKYMLSLAYFSSAVLGLGSIYLLSLGGSFLWLSLLAAAIVIGINWAIGKFFDDDVQSWISRSYFGDSDEPYLSLEIQSKELKKI